MKDHTIEVKDVVVVIWLEISELVTKVKAMIMAMGNGSLEGSGLK